MDGTPSVGRETVPKRYHIPQYTSSVAARDPLTKAMLAKEWAGLIEGAHGGWAALIDIDHLKRFNMHNGHSAGDQVLVALAAFLLCLETDAGARVVRTGGQEFALVSQPETTGGDQDGRATCDRVLRWARDAMTPAQATHCGDPACVGPTRLTLSIALERIEPGEAPASLRERLALTLLEAKRSRRSTRR